MEKGAKLRIHAFSKRARVNERAVCLCEKEEKKAYLQSQCCLCPNPVVIWPEFITKPLRRKRQLLSASLFNISALLPCLFVENKWEEGQTPGRRVIYMICSRVAATGLKTRERLSAEELEARREDEKGSTILNMLERPGLRWRGSKLR